MCASILSCPLTWDIGRTFIVLAGVAVAVYSLRESRKIARRKQTADTLLQSRTDDQLRNGIQLIRQYHEGEKNIRCLGDANGDKEELFSILYVLNYYESVAVGIAEDIFDDAMWRKSQYSQVVKLWSHVMPLVHHLRTTRSQPTMYQELEGLAKRWMDNPLKPNGQR